MRPPLVCPDCHGPLDADVCARCEEHYPRIGHTLFFRAPSTLSFGRLAMQLSRVRGELLREVQRWATLGTPLATERARVFELSAALADSVRDELAPFVEPGAVEAVIERQVFSGAPAPELPFLAHLSQLRRDWGGEAACEREIADVLAGLLGALGAQVAGRSVVMAGAKSGRLAQELALRGALVEAVDFSGALGLLRGRLVEGALELGFVSTSNRRHEADTVVRRRLPGPVRPDDSVRFIVADPAKSPFAANSIDDFVSAYFTDVGPPLDLLDEVARVLKPGGRFVHFGPLGFGQLPEHLHLTGAGLCEALRARGFDVVERPEVTTTYLVTPEDLHRSVFDNLVIVATKRA